MFLSLTYKSHKECWQHFHCNHYNNSSCNLKLIKSNTVPYTFVYFTMSMLYFCFTYSLPPHLFYWVCAAGAWRTQTVFGRLLIIYYRWFDYLFQGQQLGSPLLWGHSLLAVKLYSTSTNISGAVSQPLIFMLGCLFNVVVLVRCFNLSMIYFAFKFHVYVKTLISIHSHSPFNITKESVKIDNLLRMFQSLIGEI